MDRNKLFAKILCEIPEETPGLTLQEINLVKNAIDLGLGKIIENPAIDSNKKQIILKKIFADQISNNMLEFVSFLVKENEIADLGGIIMNYEKLIDKQGKLLRIETITAEPLMAEKLDEIKKFVREKFKREPLIDSRIDKNTLGGVAIKIGDKVYDNTLNKKIEEMYRSLCES